MRRPDAAELIDLFDGVARASPPARTRALLELAFPEEALARETPGARNVRLLALRGGLFGRQLPCVTACPACGTTMEFNLDTAAFAASPPAGPVSVVHGGTTLSFRLPTMADIEVVVASAHPVHALATHCLQSGEAALLDDPAMLDAVSAAFDAADPLGNIALEAACPDCAAVSNPVLDPADLLWTEIAGQVARLYEDVHTLARAYGWSERDILALPEARRRRYIAMVTA